MNDQVVMERMILVLEEAGRPLDTTDLFDALNGDADSFQVLQAINELIVLRLVELNDDRKVILI